jgi:hypothetical protein
MFATTNVVRSSNHQKRAAGGGRTCIIPSVLLHEFPMVRAPVGLWSEADDPLRCSPWFGRPCLIIWFNNYEEAQTKPIILLGITRCIHGAAVLSRSLHLTQFCPRALYTGGVHRRVSSWHVYTVFITNHLHILSRVSDAAWQWSDRAIHYRAIHITQSTIPKLSPNHSIKIPFRLDPNC